MESVILFILVLSMLAVGIPIAVSLGLSSLIIIIFFSHDSLASIALKFYELTQHYTLLAIPFFVLASNFMSTGGVARRIIRFAVASVGHVRGGLAIAGVFACMLFAALSGSSPATVVAIGTIAISGMVQVGYTKEFAAGVIANAGTLGILIPPSIVMVVYCAATDVSVGRMFLAGVIPGIVAGLMLMAGIYIAARIKKLPAQPFAGVREIVAAAGDSAFGLLLIFIILGGIYGGVFTPTEAAAVAAVYAFLVALFVYRDMGPLRGIPWREPDETLGRAVWRNLWLTATRFVPGCFHGDTKKVLVEFGAHDHHADVHHRQRAAIRARADDRAHPAGDHRLDAGRRLQLVDVPDRRKRAAAARRPVHGTVRAASDRGAAGFPDRHSTGGRSNPPRHHHGGEHGDRHDYPADRA